MNPGNTYAVAYENIIPIGNIKRIILSTDLLKSSHEEYHFSMATYSVDHGLSGSDRNVVRNIPLTVNNEYEFNENEKGFAVSVAIYDTQSMSYRPIRLSDFKDNNLLYTVIGYPRIKMRNGTAMNPGNTYAVSSEKVIPRNSIKSFSININRPNKDGYVYLIGVITYSVSEGYSLTAPIVRPTEYVREGQDFVFSLNNNEKGFSFSIFEKKIGTYNTYSVLRDNDFIEYDISIIPMPIKNPIQQDELSALYSVCMFNKLETNKKTQFNILADTHNDINCINDCIDISNSVPSIDFTIGVGDFVSLYFDLKEVDNIMSIFNTSEKPLYYVVGNHDVGNSRVIQYCATNEQVYTTYVKPIIDKGLLDEGEYIEGKNYYYHDFKDNKIRAIFLYEYDDDNSIDDNSVWEAVPYNKDYEKITSNKRYNIGDYVNAGNYTEYSFRAKSDVTTKGLDGDSATNPCFKTYRGTRVIRKEQAMFICETLLNTPDGYSIIVVLHQPVDGVMNVERDNKFTDLSYGNTVDTSAYISMTYTFLSEIVKSYIDGISVNMNVEYYKTASHIEGFNLSYDFSQKKNTNFIGWVGGHMHRGCVLYSQNDNRQKQIISVSTSSQFPQGKTDISVGELLPRIINNITLDDSFKIVRIGAKVKYNFDICDFDTV